ncbi:MAG: PD-(D/E)XK nuclease family protein, partial [Clostridia bacterium]|nr:PD-(D/E)XK nuclease family protein [Clostridia bacterium]
STLSPPYSEEPIILQGAVDCMFEENGQIVIVDYKTDRVSTGSELEELYYEQLNLYKMAVEQITGKKVSQCLLYSFKLDECIVVKKL